MLTTPAELRRWSERCRAAGLSVGLVPTMGALHDGHRTLVQRAVADCDRVVVSVFVNPRQFGDGEGVDRYPRDLEADLAVLTELRVDAVFVPSVAAMYGESAATSVTVDASLTGILEGERRPGHFDGVALVVAKLLIACRPQRAYFGQKDAQQCVVVQRLAADLDTGVDIVTYPIENPDEVVQRYTSRTEFLDDGTIRHFRAEVAEMYRIEPLCWLDYLQLRGDEPDGMISSLNVPAIQVIHVGGATSSEAIAGRVK